MGCVWSWNQGARQTWKSRISQNGNLTNCVPCIIVMWIYKLLVRGGIACDNTPFRVKRTRP